MRWEGLFADLEGQLAAEQRRERDDEVAERTRRERALVTLASRLAAAVGDHVGLGLVGGHRVEGTSVTWGRTGCSCGPAPTRTRCSSHWPAC